MMAEGDGGKSGKSSALSAIPVIEVSGLSKQYGRGPKKVLAVDNVSFEVGRGEIFGILGPNGAGKSTIINILAGIVLPDGGSVRVLGMNPEREKTRLFQEINVVLGNSEFHHNETPRNVLAYHGRLCGISGKKLSGSISELIASFGLTDVANRNIESLSTGEKMRLALAKSLINKPKLLFMDEPTLGLDPEAARSVRDLIKRLKAEGVSIVLTTHYMHEAEELCDRVAFIYKGRILDTGTVDHLKSKEFTSVKLRVKVKLAHRPLWLSGNGYETQSPTCVAKELPGEDAVVAELIRLNDAGFSITGFEVDKPSLEDYFIRMMRKNDASTASSGSVGAADAIDGSKKGGKTEA